MKKPWDHMAKLRLTLDRDKRHNDRFLTYTAEGYGYLWGKPVTPGSTVLVPRWQMNALGKLR